jgi:hypothetical protein
VGRHGLSGFADHLAHAPHEPPRLIFGQGVDERGVAEGVDVSVRGFSDQQHCKARAWLPMARTANADTP